MFARNQGELEYSRSNATFTTFFMVHGKIPPIVYPNNPKCFYPDSNQGEQLQSYAITRFPGSLLMGRIQ
jgi:hypothetical protein